jgi:hypothetical protein
VETVDELKPQVSEVPPESTPSGAATEATTVDPDTSSAPADTKPGALVCEECGVEVDQDRADISKIRCRRILCLEDMRAFLKG